MKRPAKKIDPDTHFVCADCKRTRTRAEQHPDRLVCADRKDCRIAIADWLAKENFIVGVAKA